MTKKALITATVQSHIAQFHKPLIKLLQQNGYIVHCAAKNNLESKNGLDLSEPDMIFDIPFDRSPFSIRNVKAYKQLNQILKANQYDIIHCNTPVGGAVTRLAANKYRGKGTKVFYTAHGFHFYKGAPEQNWLIYYPVEKLLARITDKLITISDEDYALAKEKNFKTQIVRIHGAGANTTKYNVPGKGETKKLRDEEGLPADAFICVSAGELLPNKNHITLIRAAKLMTEKSPDFMLLIAGNGPLRQELQQAIEQMGLNDNVKLIGYRTDLERFMKLADIVVSASFREGLGLNLIEAMLCAKPVIGSKNRGHNELITNNKNGFLVEAGSADDFADAILRLYSDKTMYKNMQKEALAVAGQYTKAAVIKELAEIYELTVSEP